jgi:hypothetical protein
MGDNDEETTHQELTFCGKSPQNPSKQAKICGKLD